MQASMKLLNLEMTIIVQVYVDFVYAYFYMLSGNTILCTWNIGALLARPMHHCILWQALGNPVIEQLYFVLHVLILCIHL